MKIPISPLILVLLIISGCTQPYTVTATGKQNSEKIVQLQGSISDYSATVEEKLQTGGSDITREMIIKRPYMFRVTDSKGCYSVSDGNTRWLYCNGSDTATYFKDPSVQRFSEDLDYQKVFADMLNESPGMMMGNDSIDGTDTWILEITPAPRRYNMRYTFKTVRLWADIKTGMILRADLIPENSTNIGIIRFHNVTVNQGFSDDLFTYTPDPGMKIIDQKAGLYTENLAGKSGYSKEVTPCKDCPLQEMEGKQSEPAVGERVIASFGLDGKNPDRTIFLNNPDLTERFLNASEADIGTYYYPKGPVIGFGKDKGGSIVVMIDDSQKVNLTIASEIHDRISVRGRTFGITNVPCKFVLAGIVEVSVPRDTMS